ncbi:MAG: arsenite efflux MFS transporter ArsK [Rhodobiaceae bacterium]|nr:arsenite efflux MFS transporter ArsK [Rhodobiaceae bacterium]MCC0055856.1 arsenite efflux MFS transporter ArsK [Rhodobiaceae bacterium]
MHDADTPRPAIAALGITQVIGYGTLYYSLPILIPSISAEFELPEQWIFGGFSVALFLGSLLAPTAGRWADRFGAGRLMTAGSASAALCLAASALAPDLASLSAAIIAMQLAACFVLYATAFVAIVQIGPAGAQRAITHVTLIAGFASSIFWPVTDVLHEYLSWRGVLFVFAGLHLAICLPVHAALMRLSGRRERARAGNPPSAETHVAALDPARVRTIFPVVLFGFAAEGFVLAAVLLHLVPLIDMLGPAGSGVLLATLYGPAQVASRFINMLFGGGLPQRHLAVIAAGLMGGGLILFVVGAPWQTLIAAAVIMFGLGGGLTSIVGGTLPLELFGRIGYGARLGWVTAARQFSASFAPFALSALMAATSPMLALWCVIFIAAAGLAAFVAIAAVAQRAAAPQAESLPFG